MRTQLFLAALASLSLTTALEILGLQIPELTHLNVERTPGMPLLHDEPKHLLGINKTS